MEDKDFYELVSEMRSAQKDYSRNRATSMLNICKELEKRVDAEIKRRKDQASQNQISLFDCPEGD